jgi:hypothetical protein
MGNRFWVSHEITTFEPLVEDFVNRFKLEDFVVVADSGLMNQNIVLPVC